MPKNEKTILTTKNSNPVSDTQNNIFTSPVMVAYYKKHMNLLLPMLKEYTSNFPSDIISNLKNYMASYIFVGSNEFLPVSAACSAIQRLFEQSTEEIQNIFFNGEHTNSLDEQIISMDKLLRNLKRIKSLPYVISLQEKLISENNLSSAEKEALIYRLNTNKTNRAIFKNSMKETNDIIDFYTNKRKEIINILEKNSLNNSNNEATPNQQIKKESKQSKRKSKRKQRQRQKQEKPPVNANDEQKTQLLDTRNESTKNTINIKPFKFGIYYIKKEYLEKLVDPNAVDSMGFSYNITSRLKTANGRNKALLSYSETNNKGARPFIGPVYSPQKGVYYFAPLSTQVETYQHEYVIDNPNNPTIIVDNKSVILLHRAIPITDANQIDHMIDNNNTTSENNNALRALCESCNKYETQEKIFSGSDVAIGDNNCGPFEGYELDHKALISNSFFYKNDPANEKAISQNIKRHFEDLNNSFSSYKNLLINSYKKYNDEKKANTSYSFEKYFEIELEQAQRQSTNTPPLLSVPVKAPGSIKLPQNGIQNNQENLSPASYNKPTKNLTPFNESRINPEELPTNNFHYGFG